VLAVAQGVGPGRLQLLLAAASDLLAAPTIEAVVQLVAEAAREVVPAQAALVEISSERGPVQVTAGDMPGPAASVLAAALVGRDGRELGSISVSGRVEGTFDEEDERALRLLAGLASSAVEKAGAVRTSEDAGRGRLERLQRATAALAASLSLEEAAAVATSALQEAFGAHASRLALVRPEGDVLDFVANSGPAIERLADRYPSFRVSDPHPICLAFRTRELIALPTLAEWTARFPRSATALAGEARSLLTVPLVVRDRPIGALGLLFAEERQLSAEELTLAKTLADQAAQALERARLLEQEQAARRASEELARELHEIQVLSDAALGHLDRDALLETLLERVTEMVAADTAAVLLHDESRAVVRLYAAIGLPQAVEKRIEIPVGRGFAGRIAATRAPVAIHDVQPEDVVGAILRDSGVRSLLGVPLLAEGRLVGVMHVGSLTPRQFGERELRLLRAAAERAAVAIERVTLHEALAERAQAASILARVGEGVVELDSERRISYWNPAAAAITGVAAADALGRQVEEVFKGWLATIGRPPVAEGPSATRRITVPVEVAGRELWLSFSGVELSEGAVYAFRDETGDHRLEELRRDFIATVSHELRTPLAAVYGALKTLRRQGSSLTEELRDQMLSIAENQSDRLAELIDDVLTVTGLESGGLELRTAAVNVAVLVRDTIATARVGLPRGHSIELAAPDGLAPVAADPSKLRQVLGNLLENAVKYSPDGGVIGVRLEQLVGCVRISVQDEGLGIPASEHERIFEKFYRLDPNQLRGVGGTGLGLYICRELVSRMRGRIWVDSHEGSGSSFVCELPLAE
jgi:signal transduction histidine kinase